MLRRALLAAALLYAGLLLLWSWARADSLPLIGVGAGAPSGGGTAWTFIAGTVVAGDGSNTTTTSAINLSACTSTCLVVVATGDNDANAIGSSTLTDSSSNTWSTSVNHDDSASGVRTIVYYLFNPTVSSSQTFTYKNTAGSNTFAPICVLAFTGALNATIDKQSAADNLGQTFNTSLALGSITPSVNNEMLFSILTTSSAASGTVTLNSGTVQESQQGGSGSFGIFCGYFNQITAAAFNSTFSWPTTGSAQGGIVASFEHH